MTEWLPGSERILSTAVFMVAAVLVAAVEALAPRRRQTKSQLTRWTSNLALFVANSLLVRLAVPVLSVGAAVIAAQRGWGLFNMLLLPAWLAVILSVIIIDCSRYLQHWMLHRVPLLWCLHRAHHTDQEYDFSTGLRFHPLEAFFTVVFDIAVVLILGAPPVAVLGYELVRAALSVFVHANIAVPLPIDRALRTIVVTPDLHRVHHSARDGETNSNFGGVTPWWDRLFGTYIDQPADGHLGMTIGLPGFRSPKDERLDQILIQPFRGSGFGAGRQRGS